MLQNDSVDKIVARYFATVTRQTFRYQGKVFQPKPLKVSPMLLRDYTCPPGCGGCCFKFTLDYLPSEERPPTCRKRTIEFNERLVEIWSDAQEDNTTTRCIHLLRDGRCGVYTVRPFSCDFELIRTLESLEDDRPNTLTQKLFGRGWSYTRVDGGKGALCEMRPVSDKSIAEVVRKLNRLKQWANHFKLDTRCDEILELIEKGILQQAKSPQILGGKKDRMSFGV